MRIRVNLKIVRNVVLGLILLSMGFSFGYTYREKELKKSGELDLSLPQRLTNTSVPGEYRDVDFTLFWDAWTKLEQNYVDPDKLDKQQMVYGAIKGMVSSLGDPYTMFLPPVEEKRTTEDLAGAFDGVGIQLGYKDEQLAVMAPLKGMPAEKAGVKAGDLILHIKDVEKGIDEDTRGMSLPDAVDKIRGEKGKVITLTLYRLGADKTFDVDLARDTILIPSVDLQWLTPEGKAVADDEGYTGPEVAHLSLYRFGDRTESEWNDAVDQILKQNNLKGIVLDLRNNPGGYLNGAIFIASEFIDSGLVVKQQGRTQSEDYSVNRKGRLIGKPLSVVVNGGSASASEIVSGALRDRLGVKLVGDKTFGKGTVQEQEELAGGSGMHITIAKWLLPSGEWIHKEGIPVAVEATDSAETTDVDEVVQAAIGEL